jgi:SCP-2 sterol transfer family
VTGTAYLSAEWIAGLGAVTGDAAPSGPTMAVAHVVDLGQKQKAEFGLRLEDGTVVAAGADAVEEADVDVTLPADLLREILLGELAPSVAYMRGDLKIEAEPGEVLSLLAWLDGPAGRSFAERVADQTVF